jgi:hypothetical protein
MPLVPGRVADFSNQCDQVVLFVKTVEHIDRTEIKTEVPKLREHSDRAAQHDAGLLLDQIVDRVDHRH